MSQIKLILNFYNTDINNYLKIHITKDLLGKLSFQNSI